MRTGEDNWSLSQPSFCLCTSFLISQYLENLGFGEKNWSFQYFIFIYLAKYGNTTSPTYI